MRAREKTDKLSAYVWSGLRMVIFPGDDPLRGPLTRKPQLTMLMCVYLSAGSVNGLARSLINVMSALSELHAASRCLTAKA